ncbi:hypothetical protein [Paenibacillus apiarius]|uniref:hypothetical protein n=1 Tax=Paenibacillus apiarius TaxID=46240 RepID=UPI003B3AA876
MADTRSRHTPSPIKSKKLWLLLVWAGGSLILLAILVFGWLPAQEARQQLTVLEDIEMLEKRLASIRSQPDPAQATAADWHRWHRSVPARHDESAWLQEVRDLSRRTGINVKKLRFVDRQLLVPTELRQGEADAGAGGSAPDAENEYNEEGTSSAAENGTQEGMQQAKPALEQWTYELEGTADYDSWLSWLSDIQRQERLHRIEKWTMQHSYRIDKPGSDSESPDSFNVQLTIHVYASPGTGTLASG